MYREHCLEQIAPAMVSDLEVFRRGCMFAVCSIRQATINVPDQLAILFDGAEEESPLFGTKFKSFEDIMGPLGTTIWSDIRAMESMSPAACEYAIAQLLRVRGLGIVKAAFVAQLMGFDVACLDSRNVKREGRDPRTYRTDGKTPLQLAPKIRAYVRETYGRAEEYWNAWCHDVAAAYGLTPEGVSELHLAILPRDYVPF